MVSAIRYNLSEKSTKSDGVLIYYFLFTIDYFYGIFRKDTGNETTSFRPKAMVAQNKNWKS